MESLMYHSINNLFTLLLWTTDAHEKKGLMDDFLVKISTEWKYDENENFESTKL